MARGARWAWPAGPPPWCSAEEAPGGGCCRASRGRARFPPAATPLARPDGDPLSAARGHRATSQPPPRCPTHPVTPSKRPPRTPGRPWAPRLSSRSGDCLTATCPPSTSQLRHAGKNHCGSAHSSRPLPPSPPNTAAASGTPRSPPRVTIPSGTPKHHSSSPQDPFKHPKTHRRRA